MTRDEYNAKVQELQAMWGREASRIRAEYTRVQTPQLARACFEVYWDGRWHKLGIEHNPLSPNVRREWDCHLELKLRGAFAGALVRS